MRFFPYCVGALDFAATIVYLTQREYRLAFVWFCYALATIALAGVTK